jgi:hypothetical protein
LTAKYEATAEMESADPNLKPRRMTPEQSLQVWADLMDASHELVMAGLKNNLKAGEDVKDAYRRWYQHQMKEHDEMMLNLMRRFERGSRK